MRVGTKLEASTSTAAQALDFTFEIAGLATRLVCSQLAGEPRERILAHYAGFAARPGNGACAPARVDLRVAAGASFLPLNSASWRVHTRLEDGCIRFVSHMEAGWFDLRAGRGELTMRPNGNPENYLRVLYAWRCLQAGALLVHAGGVIRQGRGWVFFGPSGHGKTTAVRLSPEAQILSDDLVILKSASQPARPGVRVYGTPFRGDLPEAPRQNASAELAGLFALEKAAEHQAAAVPPALAVARLAACIPFVMAQRDAAEQVLRLCCAINQAVPVRLLRFRRDPGFWSVIDG